MLFIKYQYQNNKNQTCNGNTNFIDLDKITYKNIQIMKEQLIKHGNVIDLVGDIIIDFIIKLDD